MPDYLMEIDWTGAGDFSGTYDNVTGDLVSVECRRGRDYASQLTGRASPGKLTATLNNLDGLYSSFNSSSDLYGSILPGRKVRLKETKTFIDESGKNLTTYGDAQIDTGQSKFGGASGYFDGTGDYISTPGHTDFDVGTGDFTIECWFKKYSTSEFNGTLFINTTTENSGIYFGSEYTDSYIYAGVYVGGSEYYCRKEFIYNTNWHHLALVRYGNYLKLFLDGSLGTNRDITGLTIDFVNNFAEIGNSFKGWIDEFRFSKGIARWTTDFTPPTAPYEMDSYTKLLIHFDNIIWTGYLSAIIPAGSLGGNPVVNLEASGPLSRLKKQITPAKQSSQLTGTVAGAILDAAGWAAGDRTIDVGKTTIDQWYISKIEAFTALRDVEETELGLVLESSDGKIVFEDRHHRLLDVHQTSQATFTDASGNNLGYSSIEQQDPLREVYNDVQVTIESYDTALVSEVLWTLQETPTVAPGQTVIYWAEYPNSEHDPSTGAFVDTWDTPVVGTDITQTGVSNSDISVTVSKFAAAMKISIKNNHATATVTLTLVQAKGIPVTKLSSTTVSAEDSTSQTAYGTKTYTLPAKWIQSTTTAADYANFIIGRYKDPVSIINMSFFANKNADLIHETLTLDLSDRITVVATGSKTQLGINTDFFIEAISHRISNAGKYHMVMFELSEASGDGGYWVLGTSLLDTTTKLAY